MVCCSSSEPHPPVGDIAAGQGGRHRAIRSRESSVAAGRRLVWGVGGTVDLESVRACVAGRRSQGVPNQRRLTPQRTLAGGETIGYQGQVGRRPERGERGVLSAETLTAVHVQQQRLEYDFHSEQLGRGVGRLANCMGLYEALGRDRVRWRMIAVVCSLAFRTG
ncbi:hypothetical protein BDY21DRAFT_79749 [Lineolata rhizophorae]|uniref:Uncharacterized protein n=1 Tax=Lineolata rhizophorae TaxID=578093 RepID=A0A6A6NTR8_9PEZI|nr:hypothetical protein BDY21DRAFT_79749 [Lineolata rhizophorae]